MDRIEEFLIAYGLGQELDGAGFHRPHRDTHVRVTRDENNRNVDMGLNQLPLQIEAARSWQADVEDQAARRVRASRAEKLARRREAVRGQLDGAHHELQ